MLTKYLETMQAGLGIASIKDNDLGVVLRSELQRDIERTFDPDEGIASSALAYRMSSGDIRLIRLELNQMDSDYESGQGQIDYDQEPTYVNNEFIDDEVIEVDPSLGIIPIIINKYSEFDTYQPNLEMRYESRLEGMLIEVEKDDFDEWNFSSSGSKSYLIIGSSRSERRLAGGYDSSQMEFIDWDISRTFPNQDQIEANELSALLSQNGYLADQTEITFVDGFYETRREDYQYEIFFDEDDYPIGGEWNITFEVDGHMQLGGRKEAQTVFAFVIGEVQYWVQTLEPEEITFSGDTDRVALYSRLVKMIERNGYTDHSQITDRTNGRTTYTIDDYPKSSTRLDLEALLIKE